MPIIALVDCNNFFASCEQLLNPELMEKPVCVTSNNNGCVVARSKEAKALGVKMGMPVFMAKKDFPQVIFVQGRLGVYGEISNRIIEILRNFSPAIEVYSIDEAFVDLSGLRRLYRCSYEEMGEKIKKEIFEQVGIPVSVGISTSKTLAKAATEKAKSGNGVYRIKPYGIKDELISLKTIEVWGIGTNTAAYLAKYGIRTAYQLTLQNNEWIKNRLGKRGLALKEELLGNCISPVSTKVELPKSVQKTSSFAQFTENYNYIKGSLNHHTHRACVKLRKLGMKAKVVGIMLRTKDFRVFCNKIAIVSPSNCEFEIYKQVDLLLRQLFIPNIIYRSSGVVFENLICENEEQLSLFNANPSENKQQKLCNLLDNLENKFGRDIVICLGNLV